MSRRGRSGYGAVATRATVLCTVLAAVLAATRAGWADGAGRPAAPPLVDAVVVLAAQADVGTVVAGSRAARLATVERALRETAARTQGGVLTLLRARQAQRLVESMTPLWIVNGVAVRAAPVVLRELASRSDVREVRPDLTIQAPPAAGTGGRPAGGTAVGATVAADTVELVNAAALWELGYRGQGVVVAGMDTGVDADHPDLAGRWRGGRNSWYDPSGQHRTIPTDVNGHGTQTMGAMVAGNAGGSWLGVAPDARWIAVKIFNDRGVATSTRIHLGFQWLLDPDGDLATPDAPDVVNNSWTTATSGCGLDFQPDLRGLRAAGILPVFAAGNFGPAPGTVFSPANLPEAFAVGSTDRADALDPSSGRGPSACAGAAAPRLVAPGVGVRTTDLYGGYTEATGTSLAAPYVAGALALLLSAFPGLSPAEQEAALTVGAVDLGPSGVDDDHGYGRLDVLTAYQWAAQGG